MLNSTNSNQSVVSTAFKSFWLFLMAMCFTVTTAHSQGGAPQPTPGEETVTSVSLASSKGSVCAGGVSSAVHQATLTATAKNKDGKVLSGKSVSFSVANSDSASASDEIGSLSASNPTSGSPLTVTTGSDGTAKVTFTSSRVIGASNTVKASSGGKEGTASISMADESGSPTISRQDMIANGVDSAELKISLSSGGSVDGHSISWRIAQVTYIDEDGLTQEALPSEFAAFGSVSPALSTTSTNGIATSTFTTGRRAGTLYFETIDRTVKVKFNGTSGAGSIGSQSAVGAAGVGDVWDGIKRWFWGQGKTRVKPPTDQEIAQAIADCKKEVSVTNTSAFAACVLKKLALKTYQGNCDLIVRQVHPDYYTDGDPCDPNAGNVEKKYQECCDIKYFCCILKRGTGNGACYTDWTACAGGFTG